MISPTEDEVRMVIAHQAAEWFVTNQSEVVEEQERVAFMNWLRTSPVHVEEYLRIAAISRDLGVAATDTRLSLDALLADARPNDTLRDDTGHVAAVRPPVRRAARAERSSWAPAWRFGGVAATFAAVLAGLVLAWMGSRAGLARDQRYATGHGEQRSWALPDGSTLQLNTDSAVRARFSRGERLVELTQGQAYFSVAKDAQRRFRVIVGGAEVVAVGTQFDIDRHDQISVVTVAEGRIAVYGGAHAPPLSVAAGEQIRINAAAVSGPPTKVDLNQSESWRTGRVIFENQPLGQVVAEFNRYATVHIEVPDPALRALLISGAFDARDTNSFIAFLQDLDGVVVTRTLNRVEVSRRAPTAQGRRSEHR